MHDTRLRRSVSQHIRDMRERNLSNGYIEMTKGRLGHFATWMDEHEIFSLSGVDHETLTRYLTDALRGKAASYQTYVWHIVKSFLKAQDHPLGEKYRYFAYGRGRHVRWLTLEQIDFLLSQRLSPREGLMVCAGLYAGLRRIEVLRLSIADLHLALRTGELSVWAKNKVRTVPVHPDLKLAIEVYLSSVDIGPGARALPFTQDHYSKILKDLEHRTGIPCASHILRRSFIRMLNKRGVPIATICAIAGHSSPETTLRYIGQPKDDMTDAILSIPSRVWTKNAQIPA